MTLAIGSLCSGYEGLSMAVADVLGGELAWVADNDPGASAILAHRFPSVPNLRDLTKTDWAGVEPVDVLTAGFPCQPISLAGKRLGAADERWIWPDVARAVRGLRPGLVFLENVAALVARGLPGVAADLAEIGYVGAWRCVRASDVGAPHRRERVFVAAWPAADALGEPVQRRGIAGVLGGTQQAAAGIVVEREAPERQRERDGNAAAYRHHAAPEDPDRATGGERREPAPGQAPRGRPRADAGRPGGVRAPADPPGDGRDKGRPEPARLTGGSDAAERGDGPASDAQGDPGRLRDGDDVLTGGRANGLGQAAGRGAAADTASIGARLGEQNGSTHFARSGSEAGMGSGRGADIAWGAYGPAITRWEAVLGRPAPRPTEPGRTGERLSPQFVEWMQGLPPGWVTDVPALSRNQMLKALGNGVVPQQAAMALRLLLPAMTERAA